MYCLYLFRKFCCNKIKTTIMFGNKLLLYSTNILTLITINQYVNRFFNLKIAASIHKNYC